MRSRSEQKRCIRRLNTVLRLTGNIKKAEIQRRVWNLEEAKLNWLRQILEWQRDMSDNREFLSLLKGDLDLFAEDVYCFTPNGDVKNLPNGSTPVDFAYAIHSAVGNKMVGARVNGKLVNIDYKIQNGDRIEILTFAEFKRTEPRLAEYR